MGNFLKNETSPYLLQHADNPVDWYPWCEEAFERARREDKPVFLSIGYSTCHWCHVMAHESFEDEEVAELLNEYFISIKVDKEERPDIDSIYMSVCQAFTGSGGWPTTILMTWDQKPFFAGTYFAKNAQYGRIGLTDLLETVWEKWNSEREILLRSAEELVSLLSVPKAVGKSVKEFLPEKAMTIYKQTFDRVKGGFGRAPKFPTPHNLLFMLEYEKRYGDKAALDMVEKTLLQMYRGGIFDHIGGGFSRYSTDDAFLVPHFEKMLYDNALLIMAYCKAYQRTGRQVYRHVATQCAKYVLREMTHSQGGFYSAQDADSEGVEGKYYLLEPEEIIEILGEEKGRQFNQYFDITEKGNFEGKNIPNLLKKKTPDKVFDESLPQVYAYRKKRHRLHLDDKILTSWNGLMIAAMCHVYRITGEGSYLSAARKAMEFIESRLCEGEELYISYRDGKRKGKGLIDDYEFITLALTALYEATLDPVYLQQAQVFCQYALDVYFDKEQGGFFLYGEENEQLIFRPKETYDGAVFSGNSAMTCNLIRLQTMTGRTDWNDVIEKQIHFMCGEAEGYPAGYAMFLTGLMDYLDGQDKVTIVIKDKSGFVDLSRKIPLEIPLGVVPVLTEGSDEYPLKNDKTTFYVCTRQSCQPPVNKLDMGSVST